jgi:hypothetical protein
VTEPETLVRVVATGRRPFCAGLVLVAGRCTVAAPILRRPCLGKTAAQLRALFAREGWRATIVRQP